MDSTEKDPLYSEFESQIIEESNKIFLNLSDKFNHGQYELKGFLQKLIQSTLAEDIYTKEHIDKIQASKSSIIAESVADLNTLAKEEVESAKNLRLFKAQNELERFAVPKKSGLYIAVMLLSVLLGETVFNGSVFKDAAGGLAFGWFMAFVFAGINLILAMFAGYGCRLFIHINTTLKSLGVLMLIGFGIAGIFWNLVVANFREIATDTTLEQEKFDEISKKLIDAVLNDPLNGLGSIFGIGLFLVGFTIFLYVAKENFHKFQDPYIGFNEVRDRYEDAKYDWEQEQFEIKESFEKEKNKLLNELDEKIASQKNILKSATEALNNFLDKRNELISSTKSCQMYHNRILKVYRDKNTYIRKVKPKHFDIWIDHQVNAFDFDMSEINDMYKEIEHSIMSNVQIIEHTNNQINEKYADMVETFDSEFERIYAKAENEVNRLSNLEK